MIARIPDAEPHAQDALLARGEPCKRLGHRACQRACLRGGLRINAVGGSDQIAQRRIAVLSDRQVKRGGLLHDREHLLHARDRHAGACGNLGGLSLAAVALAKLAPLTQHLARGFRHVNRNPDGAALVGNRARNGLANPPHRIGRYLHTASIVELFDGMHQTHIAFLDQIKKVKRAVAAVLLGNGHNQPQMCPDHLLAAGRERSPGAIDFGPGGAQVSNRQPGALRDRDELIAQLRKSRRMLLGEAPPVPYRPCACRRRPLRIELVAEILLEQVGAPDPAACGELQVLAIDARHNALLAFQVFG